MRNKLASLSLLFLLAVSLAAQGTTYNWTGGFAAYDRDGSFSNTLSLTVPAAVTTVNITASRLENGCDSYIVDTYTITSGPALQIGEYAQVQGVPAGMFQILDLGTDADGNSTMTLGAKSCDSGPNSGTATVGPGFHYFLHFTGGNGSLGVCDSQSAIIAGFLDANGILQSAPSASGNVACSNSSPDGGYTVITTGSFSGTDSTGQPFTASFTLTNRNGRYGRYAQSAQWSLN